MAKTNLKNIQTVQHIGSIEQIYVPQKILTATNPHSVLGSIGVMLMSCKVHSHVIRSAFQNPNFLRHILLRSFELNWHGSNQLVLDEKSPENETSNPPSRQRLPRKIFLGSILYPFLWLVLSFELFKDVLEVFVLHFHNTISRTSLISLSFHLLVLSSFVQCEVM